MTDEQRDDLRDLEEALIHLQTAHKLAMRVHNRNRKTIYPLHNATIDMWGSTNGLKEAIYSLGKEEEK